MDFPMVYTFHNLIFDLREYILALITCTLKKILTSKFLIQGIDTINFLKIFFFITDTMS